MGVFDFLSNKSSNERTVDKLIQTVRSDPKGRYEALVSLKKIGDPKTIDTFCQMLNDPFPKIRRISIVALGEMGNASAISSLANLINTNDFSPYGKKTNFGHPENVELAKQAIRKIQQRSQTSESINPAIPPSPRPPSSSNENWTNEDIQLLKQSWNKKEFIQTIVNRLNRSPESIVHKLIETGLIGYNDDNCDLKPAQSGLAWSDQERTQLISELNAGKSITEIAKIHQRNMNSILHTMVKEKTFNYMDRSLLEKYISRPVPIPEPIISKIPPSPPPPSPPNDGLDLTYDDKQVLRQSWGEGKSIQIIANLLQRSPEEVVHILIRTGLIGYDDDNCYSIRSGLPWSDQEKAQLLSEFNDGKRVPEIANIHQRNKNGILHNLVKLQIINYNDRSLLKKYLELPPKREIDANGGQEDRVEQYFNEGAFYARIGQYAEAVASYDQVLALNPNYAFAWFNRGNMLYKLHQYKEAVDSYDKAIAIIPDYADARVNRGNMLYKLGQYTEAVASYDQVLALNPNYAFAWFNRGKALCKLGQYTEAVDSYDKVIAIEPNYANAWLDRGVALKELKRYDEADASYNRVIELDPQNVPVIPRKNELLTIIHSEQQQKQEREDRKILIQRIKETESFGVLPSQIKDSLQHPDALRYPDEVSALISQLDEFLTTARPQIDLHLSWKQIALDTWRKEKISITNKGPAHAKNVTFEFSDDVVVRRIKTMDVLAGETKQIEIPIKTTVKGIIPLDIIVTYRDARDKSYSETFDFDIDVLDSGLPPDPKPPEPHPLSDIYTEWESIGKGGFAKVFKAKRKDGKYVAVKIPILMDAVTGKLFNTEMQNWKKLSHHNIVKLYDFNTMPIHYFEMELCDGSLADQDTPIESEEAALILFNVCEGLKFAHVQKIIHRDLKPLNILLKKGVPKISDWGLSRLISESTTTTSTSFTFYYAAPEQINNRVKDERTDIWQLGVILYELVTGKLPFQGDSMTEIWMGITTKDPISPGEIKPEAKVIDAVVMKCLQKDPAKRYQSVLELQKDLARHLGENYEKLLKKSVTVKDYNRSAHYCGDLVMFNLLTGEMKSAHKYLLDLVQYSKGDVKDKSQALADQLKILIAHGDNEISDEFIHEAEIIVHQVSPGFRNHE